MHIVLFFSMFTKISYRQLLFYIICSLIFLNHRKQFKKLLRNNILQLTTCNFVFIISHY